ncbi:uncharacterized protein [Diadema antillarum]|uniref:uncharacterized protein n=1 Tax=Diadema antillarum TaxID=105358 RepID=UPI003A84448D
MEGPLHDSPSPSSDVADEQPVVSDPPQDRATSGLVGNAQIGGILPEQAIPSVPRRNPDDSDDDRSTTLSSASRRSNRSTSSRDSGRTAAASRLREARIKLELAKARKEQLKRKQELTREQLRLNEKLANLELEHEIENAEIETRVLACEVHDVVGKPQYEVNEKKDEVKSSVLNPDARVWSGAKGNGVTSDPVERNCTTPSSPVEYGEVRMSSHDLSHAPNVAVDDCVRSSDVYNSNMNPIFHAINVAFSLPKPDLVTFDGNPTVYRSFINSFEVNVEQKVLDDRTRLTYLIQYCSGKARNSIENCVLMEPREGYAEAKRILREQFGQPHVVANAHLDKILKRSQVKQNDHAGLWDLARDMKHCGMVLAQMGYLADANGSETLLKIQRLLPVHLQAEWARRAHAMMVRCVVPNFDLMTTFVEESAQLASNIFGRNIGKAIPKNDKSKKETRPRGTAFATQRVDENTPRSVQGSRDRPERKCPCCQGRHNLTSCESFKKKGVDDRRDVVRKARLCFNCLRPFHLAVGCLSKARCEVTDCGKKHHALLHTTYNPSRNSPRQENREDSTRQENQQGVKQDNPSSSSGSQGDERSGRSFTAHSSRGKICLRVVPVKVGGNGRQTTTWALLDEGSDVSLCTKGLVDKLGLTGTERSFKLSTVDQTGASKRGLEVSMSVQGVMGQETLTLDNVWTVDSLPVADECFPNSADVKEWSHLNDIALPSMDQGEVELLVGADTPEAFWNLEQRVGNPKEPYAVRTPLGWTLMGPVSGKRQSTTSFHANFTRLEDDSLEQQLKQFWRVDFGGYLNQDNVGDSVEDLRALKVMKESAVMVDGHYQVALPWRSFPPVLPNNRRLAEARLGYLKKRLERNEALRDKYVETVSDYIAKGYAKEVECIPSDVSAESATQEEASNEPVWYLPHHAVVHPRKKDKVRVVFDCAARYGGTSLNEQLLQGPDLTNNLVGVLTRFRQEQVAIVADIQSMFHQVKVPPRDRNAMRFLWWKDGDLAQEPAEYCMTVHLFGATSSPSCASFALRKTAEDNRGHFNEEVINTVKRNFYVDDCLKSVKDRAEAVTQVEDIRDLLSRGGFRLTKWLSNDRDVLGSIPEEERAASVSSLDIDELPAERTLGILWDVETDCFGFKVHLREKPATRRGILSIASSLYDPLGFVAPFVLPAKILLQRLCRVGLGWDEPVGAEDEREWRRWMEDISMLTDLKIERCFKPNGFEVVSAEVHHFCDASEVGYASVAYLRLTDRTGRIHCAFVMGKSRLAPVKVVSIPRLELMAAVLAVSMDHFIKSELDIQVKDSVFWTDSTSVLQYIHSESKRFKMFVANRVARIHDASEVSQWRYVDSKSNPSDDGSRGLKAQELLQNQRWLKGPDFLWRDDDWPIQPEVLELRGDTEVKKAVPVYAIAIRAQVSDLLHRYSSWNQLRKSTAWLLRFKKLLQVKAKGESTDDLKKPTLSADELKQAEKAIVTLVQRDEFSAILEGKQMSGTVMSKLNPILVDGIIRVGGRLENAPLDDETKHPIILPSDHHVTKLLIVHHHHLVGHSGAGMTWTALREKYWVLKGGATVRKVIGKCFSCKRRNAKKMEQFMADLPSSRVTPDKPPFSYVGIDYFGPIMVKQGRSRVKRYGCLFTCLNCRAVHLEVANTLDTDSFINALRRFISRRGKPSKIISDNGSNFRGAERELRENLESLSQTRVTNFLAEQGIDWNFNTPTASHMGGAWERMVRSVRKILTCLLGQQIVNDEVLSTLMAEVESILNARPLTQLNLDPNDDEPLTPNHLLIMRKGSSLPPGVFDQKDAYGRRRWRQVQYLASVFWKRWQREYLLLLQERQKWNAPRRNLAVNDLVLVADETTPRGQWPLGKVVEVYPGKDGHVRQAQVRVGTRFFKRPIAKLCLLEAAET